MVAMDFSPWNQAQRSHCVASRRLTSLLPPESNRQRRKTSGNPRISSFPKEHASQECLSLARSKLFQQFLKALFIITRFFTQLGKPLGDLLGHKG
jgi:hypothetical protein